MIGYSGRSLKQLFFIFWLFLLRGARPKPELLGAVRPDGTQIYSTGSAYTQTVSRLLVMNGRSSAEARATKVGRQYDGIQCVRRQRAPMVPIIAYMWLMTAINANLSKMAQHNDVNHCRHVARDCSICNFGQNGATQWCQQLYTCGAIAEGPCATSQLDAFNCLKINSHSKVNRSPKGPAPRTRTQVQWPKGL